VYGGGTQRLPRPERGYGEKTNRDLLVEMCKVGTEGGKVLVANTWFRKSDGRKATYVTPGVDKLPPTNRGWDPDKFPELDFCLVPERWKGMVQDVESDTRAGVPSDHFPLRVRIRLRLRARRKDEEGRVRWDFAAATEEQKRDFDEFVADRAGQIGRMENVDKGWSVLKDTIDEALPRFIPKKERQAKRPWIRTETLELMASRAALAELGQLKDARELDMQVRQSAREDRKVWIKEGLEDNMWQPIRAIRRKRAPPVVTLEKADGTRSWDTPAAEVYGEYLETTQWGRTGEEPERAKAEKWGVAR